MIWELKKLNQKLSQGVESIMIFLWSVSLFKDNLSFFNLSNFSTKSGIEIVEKHLIGIINISNNQNKRLVEKQRTYDAIDKYCEAIVLVLFSYLSKFNSDLIKIKTEMYIKGYCKA